MCKVENIVIEASKKLLQSDSYLLKYDINEPSITHKLAEYLQQELRKYNEFNDYHVDCEYNKELNDIKTGKKYKITEKSLKILGKEEIDTKQLNNLKGKEFSEQYLYNKLNNEYEYSLGHIDKIMENTVMRVYPDIIIHKRGTENNLLVIESTKSTHSPSKKCNDKNKLKNYRDKQGYKHILYIEFYIGEKYDVELTWYKNGKWENPYKLLELLQKVVEISFSEIIDPVTAVILKSLVTKFPQLSNIAL
ncbi:MAG: hypothetical protein ABRQ39_25980 [Candidatus Eremiobacterota bacterium]